jgi:hypothetical protein
MPLDNYLHVTPEEKRDRARAYLAKVPGAVQGESGDNRTYAVACILVRDFALGDEDALAVIREWNTTCVPPWSEHDLATKIRNAQRYAYGEYGAKLTAGTGRPDPDAAYDDALLAAYDVSFCALDRPACWHAIERFDRALKWNGAMRSAPPVERCAALFLAMFAPGRVERGPERIPWIMERGEHEYFRGINPGSLKERPANEDENLDTMVERYAHEVGDCLPCGRPEPVEEQYVNEIDRARFRETLSPLQARIFDLGPQALSGSRELSNLLGVSRETARSARSRIVKKWIKAETEATNAERTAPASKAQEIGDVFFTIVRSAVAQRTSAAVEPEPVRVAA